MKIRDLLQEAGAKLKRACIDTHAIESRLLMVFILNATEEFILLHPDQELSNHQVDAFNSLVLRREMLEPIAYIIGSKEFYGRDFIVTKDVLIPRPDSETLIESVLSEYHSSENLKILELGSGSGCLILTLLLELKTASALAIDIDSAALNVARKNAAKFNVENIEFLESNWFESIDTTEKFDIIIANPPYIALDSIKVAKETVLYEPKIALFAKDNGLSAYKEIAAKAHIFLNQQGSVFLEIGYDQEQGVTDLFLREGYIVVNKERDLGGYVRCISFKYK